MGKRAKVADEQVSTQPVEGADRRRSLGEVGYDAYKEATGGKSAVSGADLPHFSNTNEKVQNAWEVAALAIASAVQLEQGNDSGKMAYSQQKPELNAKLAPVVGDPLSPATAE
jgi:ketopantoate hydroxymethyltransferase